MPLPYTREMFEKTQAWMHARELLTSRRKRVFPSNKRFTARSTADQDHVVPAFIRHRPDRSAGCVFALDFPDEIAMEDALHEINEILERKDVNESTKP